MKQNETKRLLIYQKKFKLKMYIVDKEKKMDNETFLMILEELKYIRVKVDNIESKMITKEECKENMESCPLVKKKSST
jgi:hypothetical protein